MGMQVDRRGDVAVITADGQLKLPHGDAELRRAFHGLFQEGATRFVLDLRQVTALDSACLGEILANHKHALDVQGSVHVVLTPDSRIHEFFTSARLDRVFNLYTDARRAVTGFS